MKQPNFFIIGAGKCGTTSLAAWLSEHPKIFMSDPKELHFFCKDIYMANEVKTMDEYLQIFQNAGDQHLGVGEASPTYLLSHVAVKNILEFNPAAKFIVMLRNPIEMARSWHGQLIVSNAQQVLDDFEADWKARYAGKLEPNKRDCQWWDPIILNYPKGCRLGEQVQRLLQTVDLKPVLFIVMDDLISDPLHEYQRVLEFLEIPYDGKTQFPSHNPAKRPRTKLLNKMFLLLSEIKRLLGIQWNLGLLKAIYNFNLKSHKTLPLRAEFKNELIEVFREDVNLLSSLLGRDFSHWLQ